MSWSAIRSHDHPMNRACRLCALLSRWMVALTVNAIMECMNVGSQPWSQMNPVICELLLRLGMTTRNQQDMVTIRKTKFRTWWDSTQESWFDGRGFGDRYCSYLLYCGRSWASTRALFRIFQINNLHKHWDKLCFMHHRISFILVLE